MVWAEEKILIDGHNRYAICTAHGIPYQTVEMSFDSPNTVKVWMLLNQLAAAISRLSQSAICAALGTTHQTVPRRRQKIKWSK